MMKKRIFIWFLVMVLTVSLAGGCKQAEEENDTKAETSSEKFETSAVEQTQESGIQQLKEQSAAAAANSQESSREEKSEAEALRTDKNESEESTESVSESSAPEESSVPAESSAPTESSVPAESSAPVESSAPTESSASAESSAPAESSTEPAAESSAPPVEETPTEKLVTAGEITVGKTYIWEDYGAVSAFLELTNNTSDAQAVRTTIRGYDTAGTVVEGEEGLISVIGPGETALMEMFIGFFDAPVDHLEYELYIRKTTNESGIQDIEIKETDYGGQIIYEATNICPYTLSGVRATTLFLDAEGKVLNCRTVYMHDIDWELKVGGIEAECMWVPLDEEGKVLSYSSRVTYFYGRRLQRSDQAAVGQPAEIQVLENHTKDYNGGFYRVLVYKNVSTEPLKVRITFATHDPSNGAPVWVSHYVCEVLEPGASMAVQGGQSIRAELGVDSQEIRFEVARTTDTSANSDLTVSAQPIGDGGMLALQITNNSSQAVDSLDAFVIAYDSAGNLLVTDSYTFSDWDGALAAGGTSDEIHMTISTAQEKADHWSLFIASAYYNDY